MFGHFHPCSSSGVWCGSEPGPLLSGGAWVSSESPPHQNEVSSASSPQAHACSGLQWPRPSNPEKSGRAWGWEKKLNQGPALLTLAFFGLPQVVPVKEGTILRLDNEMTQVGSQTLFQRELRKGKARHIPKLLKYLEGIQSPTSQIPWWAISTGTVEHGDQGGKPSHLCGECGSKMALPT